ncbi:MAG TPA: hypothetical protein VGA99_08430 [bacterium]
MREGFHPVSGSFFVALFALFPAAAFAQRPPAVPVNLSYLRSDFIQPGARPAAMGGAFIGAAQDEIAAVINPAGLPYLRTAGASVHLRAFKLDGRFDSDQFVIAAFFPIKKINLAFSRQVIFNTRFSFENQQFVTFGSNPTLRQVLGGLGNFPGTQALVDFHVFKDRWSLGYQIWDKLSLGVTASNFTIDLHLKEQSFLDPLIAEGSAPRGNIPETTYSTSTLERRDGLVWGYSLGLMATLIPDKFYFGAVVDFNPSFDLQSQIFLPEYRLENLVLPAETPENNSFKFSVPDVQGIGFYYRVTNLLHLTFDLVRREYRDLLSGGNASILNIPADDEFDQASLEFRDPDGQPDLSIDNAIELHLGVERLFRIKRFGIVPLRFGIFNSPRHRIHARAANAELQRLFPPGTSDYFFSFGTGVVGRKYYKYDLGASFSDDGWQLFFSATFKVTEY